MAKPRLPTLANINRSISAGRYRLMKIRVADETTDKIDLTLSLHQGWRQHNRLSSLDLVDCVEMAEIRLGEIGLPKGSRPGAEVILGGGSGPQDIRDTPTVTTIARMVRTKTGWFLVEVWSDDLYPQKTRPDHILLTSNQDNIAVANFRRQYRVKSA